MGPGAEVLDLNDDMGEDNEVPSEIPQIQVTDPPLTVTPRPGH